jgi:hypothetical protein
VDAQNLCLIIAHFGDSLLLGGWFAKSWILLFITNSASYVPELSSEFVVPWTLPDRLLKVPVFGFNNGNEGSRFGARRLTIPRLVPKVFAEEGEV